MNRWWRLGEGMGQLGNKLALYQIECAFCNERGSWELEHRAEKKQPNGEKVLFFDTYKCGNCASYVMVLWSASEDYRKAVYTNRTLHDYHVLPWPLGVGDGSKNWPAPVPRFWKQAHNALNSGDYDSAAIMTRSALQAVTRQQKAKKGNLKSEIEDLASRGILPPVIKDWSHEVRELGNPVAHPDIPDDDEEDKPTEPQDAEDIVEFMDYLLKYVYDIPAQVVEYRARRQQTETSDEVPEGTPGTDDRLDVT